jgi:hypothetical protein
MFGVDRSKYVGREMLNQELSKTWAILTGQMGERAKKVYSRLDQPNFLCATEPAEVKRSAPKNRMKALMSVDCMDSFPAIQRHLNLWNEDNSASPSYSLRIHSLRRPRECFEQISKQLKRGEQLSYDEFTIFEHRLRALRAYMDSAQPRGLRQLWKDNRNSLAYYTFWGVLIFGGATFLTALLALFLAIAQTVAAYKALNLAPASPSPT